MENVGEWTVLVHLFEHDDDRTLARAELKAPAKTLRAEGLARRNPADTPAAEIGDELAVGRALLDLGHQLIDIAFDDIAALSGRAREH
jgi:hypothetical protein